MSKPRGPSEKGLTPDQRKFVDEYLIDLNATLAYRRAFGSNVSYTAAASAASRLAKDVKVRAEIAAARKAQQMRTNITADKTLREIARVAFADVLELFDPTTGDFRRPREIPLELRRAIASLKVRRGKEQRTTNGKTTVVESEDVIEVKLSDKLAALEKLCRHLGLSEPPPALEVMIALLPPELRGPVRAALAGQVHKSDGLAGDGGGS